MKIVKTYEGFFDFLKRKEKVKISFDEVMDCLYDITDETRIKNQLNGSLRGIDYGIFADENVVFKKRPSLSLGDEHDAFMNDEIYSNKNFKVRKNAIAFDMVYKPSEISDAEVNDLLLDCKYKLEISGCRISFFIGWGYDEGSSSDKEWTDFMKMIDKTINKTNFPDRSRNITIKIESPGGFN